ncbi:MAG: hypothetical protein QM660_15690, partial [Dysgonomonas sp.]
SSKGEFTEFHDQTDIVEIGSVLYNTETNEIIKVLEKDETTIDISSAITAMSIDPLCEKYYWISPYAYVANNPLKYIDPDGRKLRIANEPKIAAESIARIAVTNRGAAMFNQLIGSENLYTLKQTWFGAFSAFNDHDPKNNIILYGSTNFGEGDADYPSEIIMSHESMHAFDHSKGFFTDSRTMSSDLRKSIEQRGVSMENYIRDVYSMSPLRDVYKGMGKKGDSNFFQMPANGEKVSNFKSLGGNKDNTRYGFSFQKENGNTRYISVSYDKDKNVMFSFYDTEDEYNKATQGR